MDTTSKRASKHALFIAPEAPYPMVGGGALRSASLLAYLARTYRVDVITFREPGAPDPRVCFPPGTAERIHVVDLPRHGRHLPARILRNLGRAVRGVPPLLDRFSGFESQIRAASGKHYEVAIIEHFWCAPYWRDIAPICGRTVLNLHNIESVLHARCARAEGRPLAWAHKVFERGCRRLEQEWLPRFSDVLVTSPNDAELVRQIAPETRISIYPNILPAIPRPARNQVDHAIVFSGNLAYHPNISAVRFFRRHIWPDVRRQWPGLTWRLIGKNADSVRKHTAGDPRIELIGAVEDAVCEIAKAKIAVVPVLSGSGTRYKIVEAWAAGVPVVSTTLGAEGLPACNGENIILADAPAEFTAALAALLESSDLREQIGRAGRETFERECTWEAAWSKLDL